MEEISTKKAVAFFEEYRKLCKKHKLELGVDKPGPESEFKIVRLADNPNNS